MQMLAPLLCDKEMHSCTLRNLIILSSGMNQCGSLAPTNVLNKHHTAHPNGLLWHKLAYPKIHLPQLQQPEL